MGLNFGILSMFLNTFEVWILISITSTEQSIILYISNIIINVKDGK